jgi:hypothetical protein
VSCNCAFHLSVRISIIAVHLRSLLYLFGVDRWKVATAKCFIIKRVGQCVVINDSVGEYVGSRSVDLKWSGEIMNGCVIPSLLEV